MSVVRVDAIVKTGDYDDEEEKVEKEGPVESVKQWKELSKLDGNSISSNEPHRCGVCRAWCRIVTERFVNPDAVMQHLHDLFLEKTGIPCKEGRALVTRLFLGPDGSRCTEETVLRGFEDLFTVSRLLPFPPLPIVICLLPPLPPPPLME
uniref:Uncharacterized protein n=1 Tax=Echinococcus granulosus TaxID=6210 RepID=A0A068WXY0_ECHGR|nr:hypothetical protein EgrG_002037900 [Echinococcus granulosus]